MANDGPPDGYVTSAEACARLGISDRTLRRRVAAGAVEGEYLPRPQGSVLYVKLPGEDTMEAARLAAARGSAAISENAQRATDAADPAIQAASGGAAPTTTPVLTTDLLRAAIDPYVQMNQRIAELYQGAMADNAALAERAGRAEAEAAAAERERRRADDLADTLIALRASLSAAQAERDRLAAELARRRWWRWW